MGRGHVPLMTPSANPNCSATTAHCTNAVCAGVRGGKEFDDEDDDDREDKDVAIEAALLLVEEEAEAEEAPEFEFEFEFDDDDVCE